MIDAKGASLTKERILSTIKYKGPSLPVHISKALNLQPLFSAAFLSELYGERKIKISNMRVGSSPLYYIDGQEPQLANFIEHLNHKEKEAFLLLKQEKILKDEDQEPAIRVALRAIKDFAIPIKQKHADTEKIIWKFFLIPNSDLDNIINKTAPQKKEEPIIIQKAEPQIPVQIKKETAIVEKPVIITETQVSIAETHEPIKKEKKKKAAADTKFLEQMQSFLLSKNIETLSIVEEKKKDFAAKIRLDTPLGKQEFYLLFKDKKKINEDDLTIALHKAQQEKMPALIFTTGEIDKKSQDYVKTWRNLLKVEKIKF